MIVVYKKYLLNNLVHTDFFSDLLCTAFENIGKHCSSILKHAERVINVVNGVYHFLAVESHITCSMHVRT